MKTSSSYQNKISPILGAAPYIVAVLLGMAVYLRAASGPFIWDDKFLLNQMKSLHGNPVLNVCKTGFLVRPTGGADFYRPMVTLSLVFDRWLWGNNPAGYHATNMALHAAAILMVALFAWLLLRSRLAAIAAALLFAVHPAHAESVCWISGRTDLICAVFLLGGINLYLIRRGTGSRFLLASSYLLIALALLSKELAALAPVLVALSVWGIGERNWKRIALEALPFAVISLVYLVGRSQILQGSEPLAQSFSPLHRAATMAYSTFTHFQILVLPHTAHLSYEVVMQEISNASVFAALLSLGFLTWFLWSYRRTAPIPFFGMMWFLVTILPISVFGGLGISTIVSQRFLYIPSVGLAVVFGWAVVRVLNTRKVAKSVGIAFAAAIMMAFSFLSVNRSGLWANEVVFWEQFVRDTPTIGWSYYHLGMAYMDAGKYRKALRVYKAAAELMPDQPEPQYGLAETYKRMGDLERAARHYSRALDLAPGAPLFQRKLDQLGGHQ